LAADDSNRSWETAPLTSPDETGTFAYSYAERDWDDSSEGNTPKTTGDWGAVPATSGRVRIRHARRQPPLLVRVSVVALACVVIAGLIGAAVYRFHASQSAVAGHSHVVVGKVPPVITLFSPSGSTSAQNGNGGQVATPLPVTGTQPPSQYLAPDKASPYGLSLIASVGTPEKTIVVSRFSQTIHVYENGQFIAGSYAITGRPELPTPIGVYQIFLKIAPAVLYSPWPLGSPYYYAPAPVNYTMEFRNGGFLIHDAPWHHIWGPGMNDWHYDPVAKEWQWGTHGCVTAPTPFIQWLYAWSPEGTTVIIY